MNEEEIIADLKKTIEYAQNCCREDAYINLIHIQYALYLQ